jgi:hypothetical protein
VLLARRPCSTAVAVGGGSDPRGISHSFASVPPAHDGVRYPVMEWRTIRTNRSRRGRLSAKRWLPFVLALALVTVVGSAPAAREPSGHVPHRVPARLPRSVGSSERFRELARVRAVPAQARARLRSRTEFSHESRLSALAAAESAFGIQRPVWRSPLAGVQVKRFLSSRSALVRMANGRNTVITGPLPLVVPDGAGGRVPVDLSLADSGSALAPRHPLVPLRIATHLSDGIGLGPIAIHPPASAQTGSPMVVGQRAFFANSAADTDTVVVPLPTGVAVDWVLRSAASPESEMLSLSLPRGWRLAAPRSQHGGAIIVDQHSQPEVAIAPPAAHDADGMLVRAFYRVQGDNLVVEISHRNLDVKYPIEVDPNFGILSFGSYTGYPGPGNFDSWGCLQQGREWGIPGCSDGSNLVAGTNGSSQPFQVGDYDESVYKAPGSAFVFEAALGGIWSNVGSYNSFFGQTVMSMFYGVYNADGSLEGQSVFDPNNENYVSNQPVPRPRRSATPGNTATSRAA